MRHVLCYALCCLFFAHNVSAHVDSEQTVPVEFGEQSLLPARQQYGAPQMSVPGQLQIIGTGMVPLPVPIRTEQTVTELSGTCTVPEQVTGASPVEFFILSGSNVLWQSGELLPGAPAKMFNVPIAANHVERIYLFTKARQAHSRQHAHWQQLTWHMRESAAPSARKPERLHASRFGMEPNTQKDQGPALRAAIDALRQQGGGTLDIAPGTYHFYETSALPMSFYLSNHDQPDIHPVCVPLNDLKRVCINGNGALFIFHGKVLPMLIMDSESVTVENLHIDLARSFCTDARVVRIDDKGVELAIDYEQYPCDIRNQRLFFVGEGWSLPMQSAIAFEKDSGRIVANTADLAGNLKVEPLPNRHILLKWHLEHTAIKPGDTLTLRSFARPHPACAVYRSQQTQLNHVSIHQAMGMGVLVQCCRDFTMHGGGVFIRKGSDRKHTTNADATHFSNNQGTILVENALFEAMMDDAINVHATCLKITKIVDKNTLICRYEHPQSIGFEVLENRHRIHFLNRPDSEADRNFAYVQSVHKINERELAVKVMPAIPDNVKPGMALESEELHPSVSFRHNTVRNNRARGALFTTPKTVLVTGNVFDYSSGAAILLAGDAQGWYESGRCDGVLITNNKFINNLTSRYQFTEAIISIYPMTKNLVAPQDYYHRNIMIADNVFETFFVPLVFAIAAQNMNFRNNVIRYNQDFTAWRKAPFIFDRCSKITIRNNVITPPRTWNVNSCELIQTPASEVTVQDNR